MNPIGKITRAITHPVQSAGSVAGQALDIAAAGARTTARVMEWTASQARGGHGAADSTLARPQTVPPAPVVDVSPRSAEVPRAAAPTPSTTTRKAASKKVPRKTPVKKAPSARAATAGPALAATAKESGEDPSLAVASVGEWDGMPETTQPAVDESNAEPLLDPSLAKAIRTESETLRRAADPDKG